MRKNLPRSEKIAYLSKRAAGQRVSKEEDNMSTKYMFAQGVVAHRAKGGFALIPDVVVNDQNGWDNKGKSFPAIPCDSTGRAIGPSIRARLRGELYGLYTTGTGDVTISNA